MTVTAAAATRGPNVATFFETFLAHTKGPLAGHPFVLEPWEQDFVDEFYAVDKSGNRIYQIGVLGVPRGNGKTPLSAGLGLYELMANKDSPDVYCASGSKEQAGQIMNYARPFVEGGKLRSLGVKAGKRAISYGPTAGTMRVLSSEGSLQHGLNPTAVIGDELHAFKTEAQQEVWIAMVTALQKRFPNSFALAITTAGYDKHSLLGTIYDQMLELPGEDPHPCLRIRRDVEHGILFYWYGIPERLEDDWQNEELWRLANPASFISIDALRRQLAPGSGIDEYDFKRLLLNMWTKARDAWLPAGVWRNLSEDGVEIPLGSEIYAAVDVGWSHDSTAVAIAHKRGDGKIVLKTKVWTTDADEHRANGGIFVSGGKMQLRLVKEYLRELRRDYKLREVSYDPKFFGESAQDLEREGVLMVEMLPSSSPAQNAWQAFYQGAVEDEMRHDGDKTFSAHVEAAAADKTEQGWKVRKLRSTSRIDALAAAVMAFARCQLMSRSTRGARVWFIDPNEKTETETT